MKLPKWMTRIDAFTVKVDLTDLGCGEVTLRSPPTGVLCELVAYVGKNPDEVLRGRAHQLRAYVAEGSSCGAPAQSAPFSEWLTWVGQAPSRITTRLMLASTRMDREEDGEESDSGN